MITNEDGDTLEVANLKEELAQANEHLVELREALEMCMEACRKNLVKYSVKDEPALYAAYNRAFFVIGLLDRHLSKTKQPGRSNDDR